MSRHRDRCIQCGSNYGHFRGCSLDSLSLPLEREALLRTNPEAASTYDVECLLEQYRLVKEQLETDRALVLELNKQIQILQNERDEVFRNAVAAMKAKEAELDHLRTELAESKELHADNHQTIVLQALYQNRAKAEIERLETKLAEAIGMWKGSLEAQGELEAEIVSLRAMAANLRLERAGE